MNEDRKLLTADEIDTIGEILNISMGAAATAVSTMLERQVLITTPRISQNQLKGIDFSALEPAVVVKINYIQGLSGTNVIVLRCKDMGTILNLLMGNDYSEADHYEFDEMSMSAACEVMNQMMGSSATAMSEMLNRPINISTPQAFLVNKSDEAQKVFNEIDQEENVVEVAFKMTIKETLDTTFSSIMPLSFSKEIVRAVNGGMGDAAHPESANRQSPPNQTKNQPQQPQPAPQPQVPQLPRQNLQPQQPPLQAQPAPSQPGAPVEPPYPPFAAQMSNPYPYQQPFDPAWQYAQNQQPYGQPYARQSPYGQPGQAQEQQQSARYVMPSLNVKQAEFPEFSVKSTAKSPGFASNINILMGVQLEVSVVIGRAKQKIKDVLEYGQGSVIELDKQTGSPAEIVVNGQLIAYGDVVVVGDNFGIRITDIVGTDELIDSLEKSSK